MILKKISDSYGGKNMHTTERTLENRTYQNIGVQAEFHTARKILMHTPSFELLYGVLMPEAALFEDKPINRFAVKKEHENYIDTLKKQGIDVIKVEDVLLQDTIDPEGNPIEGKALDDLIAFAAKSVKFWYSNELAADKITDLKAKELEYIKVQHPQDLAHLILNKPEIHISKSHESNTDIIPQYVVNPVMNMHFLRDQQITTDKGVVIGRMNSSQRRAETEITTFVFNKLGINPVYTVEGEGRLEGGDFIPCGDFAMIGQGLRTNAEGIKQLFENQAFGYEEVAVVKDAYKKQDEMHLDTYFNILGSKKALILEDRVDHLDSNGNVISAMPEKKTTVDVYTKCGSEYIPGRKDIPFQDYLESKGFNAKDGSLIIMTKDEQLNYGCNVLTLSDNKVIAVNHVSEQYKQKMQIAGVDVVYVPLKNFVLTYGAPHCATQTIYRTA
jgi:arginine deiminase